jgi:hypothetical protein
MDFSSHVSGATDGEVYGNLRVGPISIREQIIINELKRWRVAGNESTAISQCDLFTITDCSKSTSDMERRQGKSQHVLQLMPRSLKSTNENDDTYAGCSQRRR